MTCLGVSVKRWHWERWTKARQWRAYINLLQRLVRSSWLPRESNANARKDEVYGVCMKNSFLIARATFNSKIESCHFFFLIVTRQIISLWLEPTDQWVWIIKIVIIHTDEQFSGLYCDVYIWTNLLLHHLFKNDPTGGWLPVRCLTFCYVHCELKNKKKSLRVCVALCLYKGVKIIIHK